MMWSNKGRLGGGGGGSIYKLRLTSDKQNNKIVHEQPQRKVADLIQDNVITFYII